MKQKLTAALIIAAVALCLTAVFAASKRTYIIDAYVGSVSVSRDGGKKWTAAEPEMVLYESDIVKTDKDSYADIIMPQRGMLRIVEKTTVALDKVQNGQEKINVKDGKVVLKIDKKLKIGENFQVETRVGVAAVRGTEFAVETDNKTLKFIVAEGLIKIQRNIEIPNRKDLSADDLKMLEVDCGAGQEIELTMDENKHMENLLGRTKKNLQEMKAILADDQRAMKSKVKLAKNARRLFDMMNEYEDSKDNALDGEESTDSVLDKVKNRTGK